MIAPARITAKTTQGYAAVHGLEMYYEIAGEGDPLVFIPPAFGFAGQKSFPVLQACRSIITIDLQGHGRTADLRDRPLSIEQHAEDVVALLRQLGISKADFLGESYGGATAVLISLYRPDLVRRVATYGATFGPANEANDAQMLRFMDPPTPDSKSFELQRESDEKVAPQPEYWARFWTKGGAGCPSCSFIADGFNGFTVHLAHHDVMLWAVSRAPLQKLAAYKRRMGWTFPWASSFGSDFNMDFGVGFTAEEQFEKGIDYNYRQEPKRERGADGGGASAHAMMCGVDTATYLRERPGISAFIIKNGVVHHTYSAYARGVDGLWGANQWLDRAPNGRNQQGPWWKRHDEY